MGQQLEVILAKLQHVKPPSHGGWHHARCPAHEDTMPSLAISERDGWVRFKCFAGCERDAILDALGMKVSDLGPPMAFRDARRIVAIYDYRDEKSRLLSQKLRYDPKSFSQRRPDVNNRWIYDAQARRVLYRLPEILATKSMIFLCEGEKSVDRLVKIGLDATCSPNGASRWLPEYTEMLRGKDVAILPDNDKPGWEHAWRVFWQLAGVSRSATIVELPGLPAKADVYDYLGNGGSKDELLALTDSSMTRLAAKMLKIAGKNCSILQ